MTSMEKWWKDHSDEFLDDFRTLISIPSVSVEDKGNAECPYGRPCVDILNAVGDIVKRFGFEYRIDSNQYGLLSWKGRSDKTIGLFSHMDVVPAGPGWTYPPFELTSFEDILIGRDGLSDMMLSDADPLTRRYGIELEDIIIRQIRYSDDLTASVYTRMIKERSQIAEAYRSYGRGQLLSWQGRTENDKRTILSQAYAESERIKGEADAAAAEIYSRAYSSDPGFFRLWTTLESYRSTLPAMEKVLSTDMAYFDYLYTPHQDAQSSR